MNNRVANSMAMCFALALSPSVHAEINVIRKFTQTAIESLTPNNTALAESHANSANPDEQVDVNKLSTASSPLPVLTINGRNDVLFQKTNFEPHNKYIPSNASIRINKPLPYLGCFYSSASKYAVPPDILLGIAMTESSFNPSVRGKLGVGSDHGLMQINDYWIPKLRQRFNITLTDIYEPCTNIEVASWILAHNFTQFGNWIDAVGAYNAVTKWKQRIYVRKVMNNIQRLRSGSI